MIIKVWNDPVMWVSKDGLTFLRYQGKGFILVKDVQKMLRIIKRAGKGTV